MPLTSELHPVPRYSLTVEGMMQTTCDATFESDVLLADTTVLVDFWAEWCPGCRALTPILDSIDDSTAGLTIVKINADDNPGIVAAYGVTALPTLKVFRGGEVIKTILGAKPRPALEAMLADVLE